MIGIVMAGGRGSRMCMGTEKLLLRYEKPIILCVTDAMRDSGCFGRMIALTSPNAPETKKLLCRNSIEVMDTAGDGYAADLGCALAGLSGMVLVVSGDLPLLDAHIVKRLAAGASAVWRSYIVTKKFLDSAGLSPAHKVTHNGAQCSYTGVSLVNADRIRSCDTIDERLEIVDDLRIALNVNTKKDYDLLCAV